MAHFPCNDPQCLAQKFVVFGSTLDLKAHAVEQHGGEMTARGRKDARRIDTAFDRSTAGEFGGNRQVRNRPGEREREPPDSAPPQNRRREAFRGALTSESMSQTISSAQPQEDLMSLSTDVDPVTAESVLSNVPGIDLR